MTKPLQSTSNKHPNAAITNSRCSAFGSEPEEMNTHIRKDPMKSEITARCLEDSGRHPTSGYRMRVSLFWFIPEEERSLVIQG